jgi:hypothetical protein
MRVGIESGCPGGNRQFKAGISQALYEGALVGCKVLRVLKV